MGGGGGNGYYATGFGGDGDSCDGVVIIGTNSDDLPRDYSATHRDTFAPELTNRYTNAAFQTPADCGLFYGENDDG